MPIPIHAPIPTNPIFEEFKWKGEVQETSMCTKGDNSCKSWKYDMMHYAHLFYIIWTYNMNKLRYESDYI